MGGIESGAPVVARRTAGPMVARRVVPRLRRTDRLVVGSIDAAAHVLQRRARDVLLGAACSCCRWWRSTWSCRYSRSGTSTRSPASSPSAGTWCETGAPSWAGGAVVHAHLIGAYAASTWCATSSAATHHSPVRRVVVRRLPLLLVTGCSPTGGRCWCARGAELPGGRRADDHAPGAHRRPARHLVVFAVPAMMTERLGVASVRRGYRLAACASVPCGLRQLSSLIATVLFLFIGFLPTLAQSTI